MAQVTDIAVKDDYDKELLKKPQSTFMQKSTFFMQVLVLFLTIASVTLNSYYLAMHNMRSPTYEDMEGASAIMSNSEGHPLATRELIVAKSAQDLVDSSHVVDLTSLKTVSITTSSGNAIAFNVLGAHRFNATKVDLFLTYDFLLRVQTGSYIFAQVDPKAILKLTDDELLALAHAQGLSSSSTNRRNLLFWTGDANAGNNVNGNQNNQWGNGGQSGGVQCNNRFGDCHIHVNQGSTGTGGAWLNW